MFWCHATANTLFYFVLPVNLNSGSAVDGLYFYIFILIHQFYRVFFLIHGRKRHGPQIHVEICTGIFALRRTIK